MPKHNLRDTSKLALEKFNDIPEGIRTFQDAWYIAEVSRYCLFHSLGIDEELAPVFPEYLSMGKLSVEKIDPPALPRKGWFPWTNNKPQSKNVEAITADFFKINKSWFDLKNPLDYAYALVNQTRLKAIVDLLIENSQIPTEDHMISLVEAMRIVRLLNPDTDRLRVHSLNSGELHLLAEYQPYRSEIHLAIFKHAQIHQKEILPDTLGFIAEHTDNEEVLTKVIKHPAFDVKVAEKVATILERDPNKKNWSKFHDALGDLLHNYKEFLPILGKHALVLNNAQAFAPAFAKSLTPVEMKQLSLEQQQAAIKSTRGNR